jgi:hypothetical protein
MMDDANLDKPEEDTSEGKRCRKALRMKSWVSEVWKNKSQAGSLGVVGELCNGYYRRETKKEFVVAKRIRLADFHSRRVFLA